MKKAKRLLAVLIAVCMLTSVVALVAACAKKHTVTLFNGVTGQEVGKIQAQDKKPLSSIEIDGWMLDGKTLYTSQAGFDAANKDEAFVLGETEVVGDISLYGNWIETGLATGDGYTYSSTFALSPSTFNPHLYKSTDDKVPLDYTTLGFYEYGYNDDYTAITLESVMAVGDPVNVTRLYAGTDKGWGIPADAASAQEGADNNSGYAWRITLNPDAKWETGAAITADDYVYSLQQLLSPQLKNSRASDYYAGSPAIVGAKNYYYQGQTGWDKADVQLGTYDAANDSKLVFAMGPANTAVGKAIGTIRTKYLDTLIGLGAPLTSDSSAGDFITTLYPAFGMTLPEGLTADAVNALEGKTLAAIKADATLKATWDALVDLWGEGDDGALQYLVYNYTYGEWDWSKVGFQKIDDHTVDIILTTELTGFYVKYSMPGGSWLVHRDTYEACKKQDPTTGAWSSTYGTSVDTYKSYGPYKLTQYLIDQKMVFERNDQWFGYTEKYKDIYGDFERGIDGETCQQYQTTRVVLTYVKDISTREQMFLAGQIDGFGMNKTYYDKYKSSEYIKFAKGATTYYGIICSDAEALTIREATLNGVELDDALNIKGTTEKYDGSKYNNNKTILTIKEFRQALCYALDRKAVCEALYPGGSPAISLFTDLILADPANSVALNSFDSTKEAICHFWGVEYGEGKDFATLNDAYKAITGTDMTLARQLVDKAVDKAVEAGLMSLGSDGKVKQTVVLDHCEASDSETSRQWYNTFKASYDELFTGTKLEGKFRLEYNTTLGSDFGGAIQSGKADLSWGFGWSGGELDPYGLFEVYVDAADPSKGGSPYQYDMWINRDDAAHRISVTHDGKTYTASLYQWFLALNGVRDDAGELTNAIAVEGETKTVALDWSFGKVEDALRAEVLAKMQGCVLEDYTTIPAFTQGAVQLQTMKANFGREQYIFGMGFGGIRYMTYNYTDSQWAAYVASQGGILNY